MRLVAPCVLALILATGLAGCGKKPTAPTAGADTAAGARFLADKAKIPGIATLPNGLLYQVVRSGPSDGATPHKGDEIKINYEGKLIDNTVFDSTYQRGQPAVMPLEDLVPGWMEALPHMHVGDIWTIYLPPNLGYAERGAGNAIPPNAVLVFKIELLGVLPAPGSRNA